MSLALFRHNEEGKVFDMMGAFPKRVYSKMFTVQAEIVTRDGCWVAVHNNDTNKKASMEQYIVKFSKRGGKVWEHKIKAERIGEFFTFLKLCELGDGNLVLYYNAVNRSMFAVLDAQTGGTLKSVQYPRLFDENDFSNQKGHIRNRQMQQKNSKCPKPSNRYWPYLPNFQYPLQFRTDEESEKNWIRFWDKMSCETDFYSCAFVRSFARSLALKTKLG